MQDDRRKENKHYKKGQLKVKGKYTLKIGNNVKFTVKNGEKKNNYIMKRREKRMEQRKGRGLLKGKQGGGVIRTKV